MPCTICYSCFASFLACCFDTLGNAVKRATEALVKSAQQVKEREDEANVQVNKNMVSGVAQVNTHLLKHEPPGQ